MKKLFQNKLTVVFTIIILLLLVSGVTYYVGRSRPPSTVLETRTFFCPGMNGFTFEYPVFQGWEPVPNEDSVENTCIIVFTGAPGAEGLPQIKISVRPVILNPDPENHAPPDLAAHSDSKNPHNVFYERNSDGGLIFYVPLDSAPAEHDISAQAVRIELLNVVENSDFSHDAFWKMVQESFRVTDGNITREQALEIASRDNEKYLDPNLYTLTAYEENDGWHVDYIPKDHSARGGGAPHYVIDKATGAVIKKWADR